MVAAFHLNGYGAAFGLWSGDPTLAIWGRAGVDVFFVISGVIITLTASGKTAADFVAGRVRRLLPLYYALTLIAVAAEAVWRHFDPRAAIVSLLFMPIGSARPWLQVGWSLCFEALFYAATAITLLRPRSLSPLVLAGFCLALCAHWLTGWPALGFVGNPLILEFGAGVVIARLWSAEGPQERRGAFALIAFVGCCVAIGVRGFHWLEPPAYLAGDHAGVRVATFLPPATLLVYGLLQFERRIAGAIASAMVYLGDASYSIYLAHTLALWPLLAAYTISRPPIAAVALEAFSFIIILGVSLVVYEKVERPLGRIRWGALWDAMAPPTERSRPA